METAIDRIMLTYDLLVNRSAAARAEARARVTAYLTKLCEAGEKDTHRLTVVLKARQLGFSWLVVCYSLWLMMFRSSATVLLFSKRDDEATEPSADADPDVVGVPAG